MDEHMLHAISDIYESLTTTNQAYQDLWKQHIVFSWRWWLSLFLLSVSWGLWFRYRKKESSDRLLLAGFAVIIVSSYLDFIGIIEGIWYYTTKLVPTLPAYLTLDFSILPVEVMLLLQYKPHVSPWIKALLFALFNAFVGEVFLEWIDVYVRVHWENYYSIPFYMLIYLMAHYLAYRRGNFERLT